MKQSKVEYVHFRNYRKDGSVSNFGGVTVAYRQEDDAIRVAKQGCHFTDNFSRKKGREYAKAKLDDPLKSHLVTGRDMWDFHKKIHRVPNSSDITIEE